MYVTNKYLSSLSLSLYRPPLPASLISSFFHPLPAPLRLPSLALSSRGSLIIALIIVAYGYRSRAAEWSPRAVGEKRGAVRSPLVALIDIYLLSWPAVVGARFIGSCSSHAVSINFDRSQGNRVAPRLSHSLPFLFSLAHATLTLSLSLSLLSLFPAPTNCR